MKMSEVDQKQAEIFAKAAIQTKERFLQERIEKSKKIKKQIQDLKSKKDVFSLSEEEYEKIEMEIFVLQNEAIRVSKNRHGSAELGVARSREAGTSND